MLQFITWSDLTFAIYRIYDCYQARIERFKRRLRRQIRSWIRKVLAQLPQEKACWRTSSTRCCTKRPAARQVARVHQAVLESAPSKPVTMNSICLLFIAAAHCLPIQLNFYEFCSDPASVDKVAMRNDAAAELDRITKTKKVPSTDLDNSTES